MEFGIFDEVNAIAGLSPTAVYDAHLRQVELAERCGYHSYWFAEHHFSDHRMAPSPNLMIAAAASRTERILLGNMVNVLPFHHPLRLAEECAMLDHLTHGRLQVGIGRGVQPGEFKSYSIDMAKSREMFLESVAMMKRIWTEPAVSQSGPHWACHDATLMPPVLQRPHPPLWFTGISEESAIWAGENGLPLASAFLSPAEFEAMGKLYRDHYRPSLHWPDPCFAVMRHVYVADSLDAARSDVGEVYDRLFSQWLNVALTSQAHVPESYRAYPERHARLGAMNLAELTREGLVLFGGPEEVAAGIVDLQKRGVDFLILWVSPKGVAPEHSDACLTKFASDVMPRFGKQMPQVAAR
jgi:luciferase family oxidoreductase group 1